MTKAQYTPGPWNIQHNERCSYVYAQTKIADVYSEAFQDAENQRANARLISAAPELLEALQAVKNTLAHFPKFPTAILMQIDSAITKATKGA